MKTSFRRCTATLLALSLICTLLCQTSRVRGAGFTPAAQSSAQKFSSQELDTLFAPIALYPDPLLAQMIPASTFIDQLEEANRVLQGRTDDQFISSQNWDVSVKSVAHYPEVLSKMVQQRDMTIAIGQAYLIQPEDVQQSIQRLRQEAQNSGALKSTPQQNVVVEQGTISIVPAQPQYIYVPQYNPAVVYAEPDYSTGAIVASSLISFGTGLAIGAWLNRGCDWGHGWGHGGGFYYHGWNGGGWVGASRSYVNTGNRAYVNNNFNNINVNRGVINNNISNYRSDLRNNNINRNNTGNRGNRNNTGNRPGQLPSQGNLGNRGNAGDRGNRGNAGNRNGQGNRPNQLPNQGNAGNRASQGNLGNRPGQGNRTPTAPVSERNRINNPNNPNRNPGQPNRNPGQPNRNPGELNRNWQKPGGGGAGGMGAGNRGGNLGGNAANRGGNAGSNLGSRNGGNAGSNLGSRSGGNKSFGGGGNRSGGGRSFSGGGHSGGRSFGGGGRGGGGGRRR